MKKIAIIIFALSFIVSGCSTIDMENSEFIIAPQNQKPPISGRWIISEVLYKYENTIESNDEYIGKELFFNKDAILINDDYTTNPKFAIKNVDLQEYFFYRYKLSSENLGLTNQEAKIITIRSDENYFAEFIKLDDENMIYYLDNAFYKLTLVDKDIKLEEIERYIEIERAINMPLQSMKSEELSSGVLLGIKIQKFDEDKKIIDWDYETIWINMQNKELEGLFKVDKLLVPRKNGFWEIEQNRVYANDSIYDKIIAKPISTNESSNILYTTKSLNDEEMHVASSNFQKRKPSILKNILFVGNDYISIENIDIERDDRKTLQVYAVDNLEDEKPIRLSDLIGENGTNLFNEGARNSVNFEKAITVNEENFGLVRRNGYWTLKGRVNFKEKEIEYFSDFSIKALPPKEMVSYDELAIPFEVLKLNLPNVVDAFSSPNKDFIVVNTSNNLVIYLIEGDDVSKIPVASIPLPEGSTIIMSEWATGRYPNIWQKILTEQGAYELEFEK